MKLIYNFIIHVYGFVIQMAAFFGHSQAKKWIEGREKQCLNKDFYRGKHVVWFHCASLGEYEQGFPLMEFIKESEEDVFLVVSFFSPSGFEYAKLRDVVDEKYYLPLDTEEKAAFFIDCINPKKVFFVKNEIWINHLAVLYRRKIPVYLVSASFNEEQIYFSFFGEIFLKTLQQLTHIFVKDELSKQILLENNMNNVTISGDLRFDRVKKITESAEVIDDVALFCGNQTIVVGGSTYKAEETVLFEVLKNNKENLKVIVVPHHVDDDNIERIERLFDFRSVRFSQVHLETDLDLCRVLIVDCIGKLSSIYQYADIAIVGGGFSNRLHNILEPAAHGLPVLFGNQFAKFEEAKEMILFGAGFGLSSEEMVKKIQELINQSNYRQDVSSKSKKYIYQHVGVLSNIISKL
jgi:3-deoxy-D-manno-octulosonic-acid transferase